ncbi:MAG: ATP-binding protein [Deltaproteobacteria bacterium]
MIHLVIGPVGAGKSTYAKKIAERNHAVRLTLDAWMARLYGDDERPADRVGWYLERVERCLAQIQEVAAQVLAVGRPVVLEVGLVQREARERFYGWVDAHAFDLSVYVIDAPRDVRRARVLARNEEKGETFSVVVPPEFFEIASDAWQPPDDQEQADRTMAFVHTADPDDSGLPDDSTERATLVAAKIADWMNDGGAILASSVTPTEEQVEDIRRRADEMIEFFDALGPEIFSPPHWDLEKVRRAVVAVRDLPDSADEATFRSTLRASLLTAGISEAQLDAALKTAS